MKNLFNWITNSEHSETVADIVIGICYISAMVGGLFLYIHLKGV